MSKIKRSEPEHPDFRNLVQLLDRDLALRNGDENDFYATYNSLESIRHAIIFYDSNKAVACGAFKEFDTETVEIKRMYVLPEFRGKRIGFQVLTELETWAAECGYTSAVLETGKTNPEAIRLYMRSGYQFTENFGQYAGVENSVCMMKELY